MPGAVPYGDFGRDPEPEPCRLGPADGVDSLLDQDGVVLDQGPGRRIVARVRPEPPTGRRVNGPVVDHRKAVVLRRLESGLGVGPNLGGPPFGHADDDLGSLGPLLILTAPDPLLDRGPNGGHDGRHPSSRTVRFHGDDGEPVTAETTGLGTGGGVEQQGPADHAQQLIADDHAAAPVEVGEPPHVEHGHRKTFPVEFGLGHSLHHRLPGREAGQWIRRFPFYHCVVALLVIPATWSRSADCRSG